MATLTSKIDALLKKLAESSAAGRAASLDIIKALQSSPSLVKWMESAITNWGLTEINFLPESLMTERGGDFQDGVLRISSTYFDAQGSERDRIDGVATVLAHELAHAAFQKYAEKISSDFLSGVSGMFNIENRDNRDYTAILRSYVTDSLLNEAHSALMEFNILRDRMEHESPLPVNMDELLQRAFETIPGCVIQVDGVYRIAPGITLNDDLSITPTATNLDGFYQCFANTEFYRNYYGAWGIGVILENESRWGFIDASGIGNVDPNFYINLAEFGLSIEGIEMVGGVKYEGRHSSVTFTDRSESAFGIPKTINRTAGEREDSPRAKEYLALVKMIQDDVDSTYIRGIAGAGSFGGAFGSAIAGVLPIDNAVLKVLASATLRTIGENLAEAIKNGGISARLPSERAYFSVLDDLPEEIRTNLAGAVTGAISSYLTAELFSSLGIEGTLGEITETAAGAVLTQVISNAAAGVELFKGIEAASIFTAVGSYIGVRLASELVEFDTISGQIGAQIGAAVGTYIGATYLAGVFSNIGWAAGPVGALVGAFVGYILGGIIGSFFGGKPESWASLHWSEQAGEFSVAGVGSRHGGSKAAAASLANMVASSLNWVLEVTGSKLANGASVNAGTYGTYGKSYTYRSSSTAKITTHNVEQITSCGTYWALTGMLGQLVGGDVYVKRALLANLSRAEPMNVDVTAMAGDFAVAADYSRYMSDPTLINILIETSPDGIIAAQWGITFIRAHELGLDKRAHTDWIGGFGAYLDQALDGFLDGEALSAANLQLRFDEHGDRNYDLLDNNGLRLHTTGDTITSKDRISGSANNDAITVSIDTILDASSLTIDGVAGSGSHKIDTAAVIDGGAGSDTIRGGDLGNDLLGGTGNDKLIGGALDDWLLGGDGDDVLFAGNVVNITFNQNDLVAERAALAVDGGSGNYLEGGAGNDRLYGGTGSDWLAGGDGIDRLVGGAGGDIIQGGAGDDRGSDGSATLLGGEGSDQYIFGFGDGKDVILDEANPAGTAGTTGDSLTTRYQQIESGALARNWGGNGDYEVDGSVKGGDDAIAFGAGISAANILMHRSGNDLIIRLIAIDANGVGTLTGDELTIQDWFESTRRIEWLRFANGEEFRIGDMTSFVIGTAENDVILGTYGADFLYGGGGDDVIRGLAGNDFGNGGSGNDFVAGDGDNDWVLGGSGNDQVMGGAGHDTVFGDDGDDRTYGGSGSDLMAGGRGNDEVVGGAGDDVFRYSRGDGQDVVMDDYVNNWDVVWQDGAYINGYVLQANGTVTKNGVVYFDGSKWLGQYDWDDENQVLKRHGGAVNGIVSSDAGVDTLEFGVGIDIQDLMLKRSGNDLQIGVGQDSGVAGFEQTTDRITIKDWYSLGAPIENFVFAATGRHAVSAMNLGGGSDGDDTLTGTAGKDWLTGNGGDDIVDGGGSDDILAGNAGMDHLKGGAGVDVLFGGAGSDMLDGGVGADLLFGGDGDDVASYASSAVGVRAYLAATASNTGDAKDDVYSEIEGLQGSDYDDRLGADDGDNLLDGGAGNDRLYGGAGDDTYLLEAGGGADSIYEGAYAIGQDGNETVQAGETGNADMLSVGDNLSLSDLVFARTGDDLRVSAGADSVLLVGQYLTGRDVELLQLADGLTLELAQLKFAGQAASATDDVMLGAAGATDDTLSGLAGDDILSGAAGNDTLLGGEGNDIFEGGLGADSMDGGNDSVSAGLAAEQGKGYGDTARYVGSNAAVTIDLAAATASGGHATGDVIVTSGGVSTIENVTGSRYGDALSGDARANRLAGLAGDDTLDGRAGDDLLSGGDGVDTLYGGDGADALAGDAGNDRLEGGAGKDLLSGGTEDDQLFGGADDDQMSGDEGNDTLYGGTGNDVLGGWDGTDVLYGEDGDDKLAGGAGNDTLDGGLGADQLAGEAGNDQLRGGAGSDSYVFDANSGTDTIIDTGNTADKNKIYITEATPDSIWLARVGNDLQVSVIGGNSVIVLSGYFNSDGTGTRIHEIATASGSLFLNYAGPLIQAMAAASATQPGTMPAGVQSKLADFWHQTGKAAPKVSDRSLSTNEDVAISGTVGAVDHDDNIVNYALTGAPSLGSVALDATTGAWTYTPGANRHGNDRFVITVTDADGNSVRQAIDVAVASVNDAPSNIFAPQPLEVDEGASNGLSLGLFTREDADGPQDIASYELVEDGGGRFAISSNGTLTVLNGAALDFEAATSHNIRVRVTDQAGASFEKVFTVAVNNVNEQPYIVTPPPTALPLVVAENATGGTVASFVIGDPDNTTPTLQLTTNPNGWLEGFGNTVRVKAGALVNFEALVAGGATLEDTDGDGIREVRLNAAVVATDGELSSAIPTSFWFLVEDVNEAPTGIAFAPTVSDIAERDRTATGTPLPAVSLGLLTATDPDTAANSLDYAVLAFSVDDARFEVVNGNELRLKADAALDFEAGATVTINVTVKDRNGAGLGYTRTLTFEVTNQDDYAYGKVDADNLTGQANRDLIYGLGGNDILSGGTGDDDLYGGDGGDQLYGGDGHDELWGELGNDTMYGDAGDDVLHGGDGVEFISGGAGNDTLYGDAYDDTLDGGIGNDLLDGGIGNDTLKGADGTDQLIGGDGDDVIEGGLGADRMQGGAGLDTLTYASATTGITLNLKDLSLNTGAALGDTFDDRFEKLIGTAYADNLTGTDLGDEIHGGAGNDMISGGAGADVLNGGDGSDTLSALAGDDMLVGGTGNDILIGGEDSDTYIVDASSGADIIRNYDTNGTDAIGYQDINRDQLWFSRSGDDLVISVIGTTVQTTIEDWYLTATASEQGSYKIDFIIAGEHYSDTINVEGLVQLMAGYIKPSTQAEYDTLHADLAFENQWKNHWDDNGEPVFSSVANQTLAEDGTLTLQIRVTDDLTPYTGMTVTATADNNRIDPPTLSVPDANGYRTLTLHGAPNRSGTVTVTLTATDPGGLVSTRSFVVDVTPVADAPVVTRAVPVGTTLDSGSLALDIQAALVDQDSSETLEIRIATLPTGLTLNQGTNLGNGVWSLTPAQLTGLALVGAATWSQDLSLTVTAIAKETATGQTAQTTRTLTVPINARPTDITVGTLAVNESTSANPVANGTTVGTFARTDGDGAADTPTFALANNAGGRFAISTAGVLTVANASLLNFETAPSHVIRVRVTDAGGLWREEEFTVTINNVNEAPGNATATMVLANGLGAENSALAGTAVANLSATDPDGTSPTFTITSDPRGWFTVVGNQLKFKTGLSFDFEALKAAGLVTSDIDGDGRLEVVYSAQIKATDGVLSSPAPTTVTVRIEDVNDAPSDITVGALAVNENAANGTAIATFSSTDQDVGDGRTFSLVNNASGRFAITSAGALTVANGALLNYEATPSHPITVRVTDSFGATRDETFTVTVKNVNEAPATPTIATQPVTTVVEGTALANVVAATFSATDPDAGTTLAYEIASDPKGWFVVSGNQLKFNGTFNSSFEALVSAGGVTLTDVDADGQKEASYTASVRATDGTLDSAARSVTVRIEDKNEAPSITSSAFTVAESAPGAGQTLIGTVAVTDPDTQSYNRDFRYSLTGGDTSRFSINATTGQLYLQGSLDYEAATSHQVQVTVRDRAGSGLAVSKTLTVNVTNVNEAPNVGADYMFGVANTSTFFNIPATDPEGDALTFTVLYKDSTYFPGSSTQWNNMQVYVSGGQLVLTNIPRFSTTYDIRVRVQGKDTSGLTGEGDMLIRVYQGGAPVVLDLDHDGIELVSLQSSSVLFDIDDDGALDKTGWAGSGDGFLALDRNGDGRITSGSEISFIADKPGAASDLEGLAAYDSNNDGLFDSGDNRFGEFRVWQDANQDGISQASELSSLAARDIVSIDLRGVRTGAESGADNVLYANSTFTHSDGSIGAVGDVFLAYEAAASVSTGGNAAAARLPKPSTGGNQPKYVNEASVPMLGTPLPATELSARAPGMSSPLPASNGVPHVSGMSEPLRVVRALPNYGWDDRLESSGMRRITHRGEGLATEAADAGTGDAAPGRVDRSASHSNPVRSVPANPVSDVSGARPPLPEQSPTRGYEAWKQPAGESNQIAAPVGMGHQRPIDQTYEVATGSARTALHDALALSQKKRFQMIEAISSFAAAPYAEFGMGTAKDPKTIEILTSLPDFRISA